MNPGWLISGPKLTKNKQVFKTNTLIWNLLSREWLLMSKMAFWRAITGFIKTFQTLRTCVTNISYVTNMCNQFSFLAKIMETNLISHENHKIAMKTANHENQQKTCLISKYYPMAKSNFTHYKAKFHHIWWVIKLINVPWIEHAWTFTYYDIELCIKNVPRSFT